MAKNSKPSDEATVPVIVTTDVKPSNNLKSTGARLADTARRSFQTSADATRSAAKTAGQGMASAAGAVKKAAGSTAKVAGDVGSAAYMAVGDLNGDGVVDEKDWAIVRAAAANTALAVGREAGELGKAVVRHDIVKDAAAGAAVGVLLAIPVPIIGPPTGAALGGAIGMVRGVVGAASVGHIVSKVAAGRPRPASKKPTRRKKPSD